MTTAAVAQTARAEAAFLSERRIAAGDTLEQGGLGLSAGGRLTLHGLEMDALVLHTFQTSRPTITELDLHGQMAVYGPLTAGLGLTSRSIAPDSLGESLWLVFIGVGVRTRVTKAGRISGSVSLVPLAQFEGGGSLVTIGGGTVRGIDLRLAIEVLLMGDWLSAAGRYAFQRSDRDRDGQREGISYERVHLGVAATF